MKLSMRPLLALGAIASLVAIAACSSSDESPPDDPAPPETEGGTLPPPDGSAPVDSGAADADADVEAEAPRVCSEDGFCHTTVPPKQVLRGVWADGAGVAWAVSDEGAILRFDGSAWSVHTQTKGTLSAIWGSGPTDLWVGGTGGLMHGAGATSATVTFTDVETPGDKRAPITSIWGTGASDVWAAGGYLTSPRVGRVVHYAGAGGDGGASWTLDPASANPVVYSRVWGSVASGVWLAGLYLEPVTRNQVLAVHRKEAGSTTFADVAVPTDPTAPKGSGQIIRFYDASASADGTMWLLGRTNTSKAGYGRGTTTDGGLTYTWEFVQYGPSVGPLPIFIWGPSKNDAWIGGEYGRLRHWDGTTWTQAQTTITKYPDTTTLNAMWGSPQGEQWVVGDGIALHRAKKL